MTQFLQNAPRPRRSALDVTLDYRLEPRGRDLLEAHREAHRAAESHRLHFRREPWLLRLAGLESRGRPPPQSRVSLLHRSALRARGHSRTRRRDSAVPLYVRRTEVRRTQLYHRKRAVSLDSHSVSRRPGRATRDPVLAHGAGRSERWTRRRQLGVEHGEHLLLLP